MADRNDLEQLRALVAELRDALSDSEQSRTDLRAALRRIHDALQEAEHLTAASRVSYLLEVVRNELHGLGLEG